LLQQPPSSSGRAWARRRISSIITDAIVMAFRHDRVRSGVSCSSTQPDTELPPDQQAERQPVSARMNTSAVTDQIASVAILVVRRADGLLAIQDSDPVLEAG
jgi:hypothetical protein